MTVPEQNIVAHLRERAEAMTTMLSEPRWMPSRSHVETLRNYMAEGADEIERLRTENENLRHWKALDKPLTAAMEIANSHLAEKRKSLVGVQQTDREALVSAILPAIVGLDLTNIERARVAANEAVGNVLALPARAEHPHTGQPQSSAEYHQQRGVAWDIVDEAIEAYRGFMLDDDYESQRALDSIIKRMKERRELWHDVAALPAQSGSVQCREGVARAITAGDLAWHRATEIYHQAMHRRSEGLGEGSQPIEPKSRLDFIADAVLALSKPAGQPVEGWRALSEEEQHAIGHAKYLVERATPENPEVCFDYELVAMLLRLLPAPPVIAEQQTRKP